MVNSKLIFSVLSLLIVLVDSIDPEPGFVILMTEEGLATIQKHFIPDALAKLVTPLPDININKRLDFIGTLKLNMTDLNLVFKDVKPEQIEIKFINETFYNISINDLLGDIKFNYVFKSGFYNQNSDGVIHLSNLHINLTNALTEVRNTQDPSKYGPGMLVEASEIKNITVQVDFNDKKFGRLEMLAEYLIANIQDSFTQIIRKMTQGDGLKNLNAMISQKLAAMPLNNKLENSSFFIDYSMINTPQIKDKYLKFAFNASIYSPNNTKFVTPFPVTDPELSTTHPITGYLNKNVVDELINMILATKNLNFLVVNEKIPSSTIKFTTYGIDSIIPGFKEAYGGDSSPEHLIDLHLYAKNQSTLTMVEGNLTLTVPSEIHFIVRVTEQNSEDALWFAVNVKADVSLYVEAGHIKGKINSVTFSDWKQPEKSKVGDHEDDFFEDFNYIIQGAVVPMLIKQVNEGTLAKEGINIPTFQGISFNKTEGKIHENYVSFNMDPIIA